MDAIDKAYLYMHSKRETYWRSSCVVGERTMLFPVKRTFTRQMAIFSYLNVEGFWKGKEIRFPSHNGRNMNSISSNPEAQTKLFGYFPICRFLVNEIVQDNLNYMTYKLLLPKGNYI